MIFITSMGNKNTFFVCFCFYYFLMSIWLQCKKERKKVAALN